jgi:hypothetical protein
MELKPWHIEKAVFERGPRQPAWRAVLAQLARHSDSEGVAFPGITRLVEMTGFSARTVHRAIDGLEVERWIRIDERAGRVETSRGFERKGNRYRINLSKLGLGVMPNRNRDERSSAAEWRGEGGCPALEQTTGDDERGCAVAQPVETASTKCHSRVGEVSFAHRRAAIDGASLINKKDEQEEPEGEKPPYAPPCDGAPVEIPEKLPGQRGGSGKLALRKHRRVTELRPVDGNERSTLDGEEAAMWDEVSEVLRFCGMAPHNSGRRTRRVIADALRLYCDNSSASIAQAGDLARARWQEYRHVGPFLLSRCGITKFFASGEWLNPSLWRLSLRGQETLRRLANPS